MNYLRPSTDFFGPQADQYRDYNEAKVGFHLIPQCGFKRVEAINALATEIASAKSWPEWQRYDGSIVYSKLPFKIKVRFSKEDFDDKGYINLDRIHIYSVETLLEQSGHQREGRKLNYCVLPGAGCMKHSSPIRSVTTCAALTYRLIEGSSFDVRRHTYGKVPKQEVDARIELKKYSKIFKIRFAPIWSYAKALEGQQGYFSYLFSGVTALFFMVACRSACSRLRG